MTEEAATGEIQTADSVTGEQQELFEQNEIAAKSTLEEVKEPLLPIPLEEPSSSSGNVVVPENPTPQEAVATTENVGDLTEYVPCSLTLEAYIRQLYADKVVKKFLTYKNEAGDVFLVTVNDKNVDKTFAVLGNNVLNVTKVKA